MLQSILPEPAYIYFSHGLSVLSFFMLFAVALPLIRSDYWLFRALEYPRFQKFSISLLLLLLWIAAVPLFSPYKIVLVAALSCAFIYQAYKIWPYTPLARKEMLRVHKPDPQKQLSLFCFNVLQDNTEYALALQEIKQCDPDVILLLETDANWERGMRALEKAYPYSIKKPLPNTYGMLFYSRLALEDPQICFLADEEIPSVDTKLILPSGQKVRLWGLHPKPPAPQESLTTTAKDKELMKVALMAKESDLPVIVMGDLNDVAWSYTTELFRKTSGLLDPRRGRGFYSTFSAKSRVLRFPLDYVFCSKHFGLITMKRLRENGSDHFPMFIRLQDCDETEAMQVSPEADRDERAEAIEMARQSVDA